MKLQIWNNILNPYDINNIGLCAEINGIHITGYDSLKLTGVNYTEQEGRQVTVSDIDIASFGPTAKTRAITNPTSTSGLSKYYDLRALIFDDNNSVYIDGLIQKDTFYYDPYSKTVSFTICDVLSVFLDWLDKVKIRVNDNATITLLGDAIIAGVAVTNYIFGPANSTGNALDRWTFSELLNIVRAGNEFRRICPNLRQGSTVHDYFEILGTIRTSVSLPGSEILEEKSHYLYNNSNYTTIIGEHISNNRDVIYYSTITIIPYNSEFGAANLYVVYMWRYSYGFIERFDPIPQTNTEHGTTHTQVITNIQITRPALGGGFTIFGYGVNYTNELDEIKDMCRANANFYPVTWQTFSPATSVAIRTETLDTVSITMTVTNTTSSFINTNNTSFTVNRAIYRLRAYGEVNYIDCFVSPGEYTMKQLLKDIAVSTDNYLYYSGENRFSLLQRSGPLENPATTITDERCIVKGLDLQVPNVKISICKPNPEYIKFDEALTEYYQTIINDNFNISIDTQCPGIYPYTLGEVHSLNGRNYRIFEIDYFNGLYRMTLYGKGYTV